MDDIKKAEKFGETIARHLAQIETPDELPAVMVPGNYPYIVRDFHSNISPITETDLCTLCETCAEVCPTGAIAVNEQVMTDPGGLHFVLRMCQELPRRGEGHGITRNRTHRQMALQKLSDPKRT